MSTAVQSDRKRLGVRLLTPEGAVFDGQAYMVIAPSEISLSIVAYAIHRYMP